MKPAARQASKPAAKRTRRAAPVKTKIKPVAQTNAEIEATIELTNDVVDQYGLISDHHRLF